jgi:hypothetical protein
MMRDMRGKRGKVACVPAGRLFGGNMCAVSAVCAVSRQLGKTVRLCRQIGSLARRSLHGHGKQSVARFLPGVEAHKSFVLSRWSNFVFSRPPKLFR